MLWRILLPLLLAAWACAPRPGPLSAPPPSPSPAPPGQAASRETLRAEFAARELGARTEPSEDNGHALVADILAPDAPRSVLAPWVGLAEAFDPDTWKAQVPAAEVARRRRAFHQKLPILEQVLAKPEPWWPWLRTRSDEGPRLNTVIDVAGGLVADGKLLEEEGKPAEAARRYTAAMAWAGRFSGSGSLLIEQVSTDMARRAVEPLNELLARGVLGEEAARSTLRDLLALPFSAEAFRNMLDDQYLEWDDMMEDVAKADPETVSPELEGVTSADVVRARETWESVYLGVRPTLPDLAVPPDTHERIQAALDSEKVLGVMIFNFAKFIPIQRAFLAQLGAARIQAALAVHRHEKRAHPARLEDLVPALLPSLPRNLLDPEGAYAWQATADGYTLAIRSPDLETAGFPTGELVYRRGVP